jgi:hypothetical protein
MAEKIEIGKAATMTVYVSTWPRSDDLAVVLYDHEWRYMQPGTARVLAARLIEAADRIDQTS